MTDDKADARSDMWADELDSDATDAMDGSDSSDGSDTADTTDAEDAPDTETPKNAWDVESIRDAWTPNSVRLPDSLQRRFNAYHSSVESEFALEGVARDYAKDRHFKPLVVALGLAQINEMDTDEIVDVLNHLEQHEHLDDW